MKILVLDSGEPFFENTYLVYDQDSLEGVVIDPGCSPAKILKEIKDNKLKIKYILLTHGHADHIAGLTGLAQETKAPVLVHEFDAPYLEDPAKNLSGFMGAPVIAPKPQQLLRDGSEVSVQGITFRVLHTPGHTPGSVCYLTQAGLFSGDTIFQESIGRTDFPGSSSDNIIRSIKEKIWALPGSTAIYSGHGEPTTVSHEKKHNPFID